MPAAKSEFSAMGLLELVMGSRTIFLQFRPQLYNLDYYNQKLQLKFAGWCIRPLDTQVFPRLLFDGWVKMEIALWTHPWKQATS